MYLLYLDESGNPDDPSDRHFILGGAAVFERQTFHLSQALDQLQEKHLPGIEPVEFHASPIRSGKGFWRRLKREFRETLLLDLAEVIAQSNYPGVVLFAVAVEKNQNYYSERAVEVATEEVCNRFNLFLTRRHQEERDLQRGLLVFDVSRYKPRFNTWVKRFRFLGTRWGYIKNWSDIPYFAHG